ncbi:AAA family ATPase [Paracoccus sp. DMF-8]|uniref:AAA family ATPase n=1 Tax=Paracoccus sp. DMF-8 TaxID=3019445 RepID=UPI0023E8A9AF|nr:AAA family ATPase [Paracoccus sp. DMF-8]MDF3605793.1 AAA family ATPase [Paracoccus sp. DMF-8]
MVKALSESAEIEPMDYIRFSAKDEERIKRRVRRIPELRKAASGLEHLKRDDRERLEVLKDGARLIRIPGEHRADEIAAALHEDMPWMAPATELVWHAMRRSVREGAPGLTIPPLQLTGPPGIGKSYFGRRLAALLAAPTTVIEATGENASFGVVGSQRGWGGSHPGRLIETILQSRIANPVMIVDEVEKAGNAVSMKGHAFGLAEGLLPLLEPLTARRWSCPYYQVKFDMSWVIWVLTSNDCRLLPEPLLSRCPPIRLRPLTLAELTGFVRREGARRALSETAIEAICEVLAHPSLQRHHPSLRIAARMLQRASDLEQGPILH